MQLELFQCKILESENFIVDSIATYLNKLVDVASPYYLLATSQYFDTSKLDVEIKIKANNRNDTDAKIVRQTFNYARVKVSIDPYFELPYIYYYIRKIEYVAPETYRIKMHLDVLNTYYSRMYMNISPLTHITRQHKNRYKIATSPNTNYYPHIDEMSEGLNPVLYHDITKDSTIYEKDSSNGYGMPTMDWYLVYQRRGENTPARCYIIPSIRIWYSLNNPKLWCIEDFDKTDSTLIKIIKLPYCPVNYYLGYRDNDEIYITFDNDVGLDNDPSPSVAELKPYIKDISKMFTSTGHIYDFVYYINPLCCINMNEVTKLKTATRINALTTPFAEPKLLHSDFQYTKYIYDTFSKVVKNEGEINRFISTNGLDTEADIYMYVTSTINSRFMFKFNFFEEKFNIEDYDKYLYVSRNNEVTLFNSEYLNYLKNGYNYDVKNKNRQEAMTWVTSGIGLTAGIASLIFGSKSLGVGLISSSVLSIANSINTTIQLESNLAQKQKQLQNQSASISGADDVDLMSEYAKNKLRRMTYRASEKMRKLLADLFYYTGYIDDVYEIPNVSTRIWFNYLQCEMVFKAHTGMSQEEQEEFVNKFKGGVTFLHKNTISDVDTWDFERTHENWESIFFN